MAVTTVVFTVYSGEDYDAAIELVQASPGWQEMTIIDIEAWADNDPVAEMTAYFDTEAHAMLFRLKMGV